MVGEAYAHVQGESLKAYAAFLVRLLNSPVTSGEAGTLMKFGLGKLLLVLLGILGVIAYSDYRKELAHPTCKSNWKLCSDNKDLVENNSDQIGRSVECMSEATRQARYGEPKWPSQYFGQYYAGSEYIKTGIAVFFEPIFLNSKMRLERLFILQ